jgi:hypothetical protein
LPLTLVPLYTVTPWVGRGAWGRFKKNGLYLELRGPQGSG